MEHLINSCNFVNTTNQRIDHVFLSNHFTPTKYGILTDLYIG